MTLKILHPKEIETATIQINCGNSSGTAFFVAVNKEQQILLTCDHNLQEGEVVKVDINGREIEAEILERIPERDVAILGLKLENIQSINALPLKNFQIPYNEIWETFGFPVEKIGLGGRFNGKVSRINDGTKWDVDLECEQYNKLNKFDGLSGSALVIDGFVVGVIGYDNAGTFGATSISSVYDILINYNIKVKVENAHTIPHSIVRDISNITANDEVLNKIDAVISERIEASYFLVSGSPGSGKTTLAAQLNLKNKNHVIIDRFFVKVPESEEYPTQIRATPDFFMKWLEEVYYRTLYNVPPPKSSSEKSLNERILEIRRGISELSTFYKQQGKIAFLIIDGLNDVAKTNIENYLSVFPTSLFPNIKVIFLCTSKEVLPHSFQTLINESTEIKVTPLTIRNSENFLSQELKEKHFNSTQINKLAIKSEGHPLYLRYLTKYILEIDDIPSIDDWIKTIPVIGGEIENYYTKIWLQIDNPEEVWLASTLARLRVPVSKSVLIELLPETSKITFLLSFNKIRHLLRGDEVISMYHTSFSDFVNAKGIAINEQVHKNITSFIKKYPQSSFGLSERVFHLTNGDEGCKREAIEECNQGWIDDCALNSVNPDIVLADVKNVIGLAAEFGLAHKVISLLLLSQRVNFRYNILFNENAIFLVNALLALNKPEEAIRYVVRNNTLITADGDALYLLQRFYEYGADEEAEVLLNAINQTCRNLIEKEFDADSFSRFFKLKFSAITLSSNSDFGNAASEFDHVKKTAIKMLEISGNTEDLIHGFKDEISSYNGGYFIWRFNIPPLTKKIEAEFETFKFDDRISGTIALTIHEAIEFQGKSPIIKAEDNILDWIEDLEYVIDKYGTHPENYFILLYVLLGRSKRLDLIEKLYQQVFPKEEKFDIREENGVDLDGQVIHRLKLFAECRGFFETTNNFPELPLFHLNLDKWEENTKLIFQYICFISGKVKRCSADGRNEEIKLLESNLGDLIKKLFPDLRHRMHWKRSYYLPELFYPSICKTLIQLLINNFPQLISDFLDQIVQKKNYQLGLYTEGYIETLFVIARTLSMKADHEVFAFKVVKVLEDHIIISVENRWERNELLLRLVELYALLKNEDKARSVFKEMIDTSMGPSWYKEAQLGIINTAVSNIIPKNGNLSYLQKFAAHLHNASGEMTFQRYVKQQQEEFVGDLAKIGFLERSIQYFKYLLLPDYKTIIANAESGVVDMPHVGNGYILGARAIEEQSGILDMLQNIDYKGSLIVWGLSELWILGDDRYLNDYANIQANILNYIEKHQPDKVDVILNRFSRFVVTEMNDEIRYKYIHAFFNDLSLSNFEKAKKYLESVGMTPTQSENDNDIDEAVSTTVKEKEDPLDKLILAKEDAQKKIHTENKSRAREIIVDALKDIQNQKYGIWSSNYSNQINDVRDLLAETYNNSSELIKAIQGLIINEPYFEEWIIANQIIRLLKNIDDEQEKQLILEAVLEHIDLMVRTPQSFYDRYIYISSSSEIEPFEKQEEQLLELLIWFLNHPSLIVKNRAIEILTWLGAIIPQFVIQVLIKEILSEGYKISKELSASIIHQISNLKIDGFAEILKTAIEQNELELLRIDHFMIKNSIISSLKDLSLYGDVNFENLILKFEQTFITNNKNNGEIIFEEDYLEPIDEYLYELNNLNILTKEFATVFLKKIKELTTLSIDSSQKASKYIDRSFNDYNDIIIVSDFENLLRYALNSAVCVCTTLNFSEKVASILRFYQPTFPENELQFQFNIDEQIFENEIKKLFEGKTINFDNILINGDVPLNYYNKYVAFMDENKDHIELTAYIIPLTKFVSKDYSYSWPTFKPNSFPSYVAKANEEMIPLFIKCPFATSITGSELVPAVINESVRKLIPNLVSSTKSIYWRKGRNWDNQQQGVSNKTGYFTLAPKDRIEEFKSEYKLIWQIYNGHKIKYIDVFEQKEI